MVLEASYAQESGAAAWRSSGTVSQQPTFACIYQCDHAMTNQDMPQHMQQPGFPDTFADPVYVSAGVWGSIAVGAQLCRWLQRLHLCLWTDRQRQNTHHGGAPRQSRHQQQGAAGAAFMWMVCQAVLYITKNEQLIWLPYAFAATFASLCQHDHAGLSSCWFVIMMHTNKPACPSA